MPQFRDVTEGRGCTCVDEVRDLLILVNLATQHTGRPVYPSHAPFYVLVLAKFLEGKDARAHPKSRSV